jgi:sec-independent protein translocase protein TatA
MTLVPLQIPGVPGGLELAVILLIAVLLFGANKIPKLARSTGQAMGEFQKGRTEVEKELEEMKDPTTSTDVDSGATAGGTTADSAATGDDATTSTTSEVESETTSEVERES